MTFNRNRPFGVLLAGCAPVIAAVALALPAHADPATARIALARALGQYQAGQVTIARNEAQRAVAADPGWGLAQAVLARTHLALGDGSAAEAALDRAVTAGFDAGRTHQMRAHARFLQGDDAGAIAAADRTPARYRGYADRIRALALADRGDLVAALGSLERLVSDDPGQVDAWVDLGRLRMGAGDMVGAINAAAAAVRADPNSVAALHLRALTVRAQFGLIAALPWFEAALRHDPYAHDVLIDYAATLGDVGRTTDMLAMVRRAMAVRSGSAQGYYLQAVLAARAGAYELARGVLQKGGDGLRDVPGALLLGATLDLEGGAFAQASTKLRELVARQPTNITARKLLALALLQGNEAREALDYIAPAANRADADSYTLTLAARAREQLGDRAAAGQLLDRAALAARGGAGAFAPDDALGSLATSARAAPGDPASGIPWVRALADAGRGAEAIAAAQTVVAANRGAPAAQVALGDAFATAGRFAEAAAAYRRAASVQFDEPIMLRLTDALDRAGQRQAASETLALFLSQNPRNIAALRLAGNWQLAAGEFDAAIETLERLRFHLGNRDAALLAELAYAWSGIGSHEQAIAYAGAAYAIAPANPAVADAYGWTLYRGGNPGAAVPLMVKAVRLAPEHAAIRWHMAQIAAELGRGDVAIANARAAMRDPSFSERRAAQELIATIG